MLNFVPHQNAAEKMEYMRSRIDEAQKIIQLKKEESKANAERSAKADWAIPLCNTRVNLCLQCERQRFSFFPLFRP